MGALHAGHRTLLAAARETGLPVIASIFVNPRQFGSSADLALYPRTLDQDLEMCADEGVSVVWAPSVEEMYPQGEPTVMVSSGALGGRLEGVARPNHFDGVLTVVAKLFGQVDPEVAVFGEKDAQQAFLVRQMVVDLDLRVSVRTETTVRDTDGLALSSRNQRLSPAGRAAATALSRALGAAASAADGGPEAVRSAAKSVLDAEPGLVLDYLALVDPENFAEISNDRSGEVQVLVAGVVEGTRLIDNVRVVCP
jgi:pantoate--beta-alanine ligase